MKYAPNPEGAKQFIEFLLSPRGQQLLLVPEISRLPIRPDIYSEESVPAYFPRPYGAKELGSHTAFDVMKSVGRYNLVSSLFDVMITYRFEDLRLAMQVVREAEEIPLSTPVSLPVMARAAARGRSLIFSTPIDELASRDPKFTAIFTKKRKTAAYVIGGDQGEIEKHWDKLIEKNYNQAREIAKTAVSPGT